MCSATLVANLAAAIDEGLDDAGKHAGLALLVGEVEARGLSLEGGGGGRLDGGEANVELLQEQSEGAEGPSVRG